MRALFFGAGALGTLYAARLALAGHDVTVLARGPRLAEIESDGLRLRRGPRGALETCRPRATETLASAVPYDVVVVLVRRAQVDDVLRRIASECSADVLVMVNDARGYEGWRALLGDRLIVGFAGALGMFDARSTLTYEITPRFVQPTVIGEPDGRRSARVERLASVLGASGFPVQVRLDMEAWQRAHAAWITPFMLASALAETGRMPRATLARTWARAMREALEAVAALGTPLVPSALRALVRVPPWLVTGVIRGVLFVGPLRGRLVAAGIASVAEGVTLVDDLLALGARTGRTLPALTRLRDEVQPP